MYLPRPQGPQLNHWLSRTFVPPLNAVVGQEISLPALPASPTDSEEEEEIPDVLQGEIARLEPRFKVGFFFLKLFKICHTANMLMMMLIINYSLVKTDDDRFGCPVASPVVARAV